MASDDNGDGDEPRDRRDEERSEERAAGGTGDQPDAEAAAEDKAEAASGGEAPGPEEGVSADDFRETFQRAAQKVLEERFGVRPKADGTLEVDDAQKDKLRASAQEVLFGLFQQFGEAAREVRAGKPGAEGAGAKSPDAGNVIDLGRARRERSRREPSELEKRIAHDLRAAFDRYVAEEVVPPGAKGTVDVDLSPELLKDHGPALAVNLFSAFARAIIPEHLQVDVPVGERSGEATTPPGDEAGVVESEAIARTEAEAAEEPGAEREAGDQGERVQVKLNVDLGGLFRGLLRSAQESTTRKGPPKSDE